jgi:hypothetical protein
MKAVSAPLRGVRLAAMAVKTLGEQLVATVADERTYPFHLDLPAMGGLRLPCCGYGHRAIRCGAS